jgi:uncharacterized protein
MPLTSFVCGLIFGFGLLISGMTQPAKVLGFFDVLGVWDPTLFFVMVAALVVSGAGFWAARRQRKPILAPQHLWPTRTDLDWRLISGSVLFGIGWGLVGLCPGPAIVNVATLLPSVLVFVSAMLAGLAALDVWNRYRSSIKLPRDDLVVLNDG